MYETEYNEELGARVHAEEECKLVNGHCVIHKPSNHHMRDWPKVMRASTLIERTCPHGIGHPDPDSVAFFKSVGVKGLGIHGCDGCCAEDDYELPY